MAGLRFDDREALLVARRSPERNASADGEAKVIDPIE